MSTDVQQWADTNPRRPAPTGADALDQARVEAFAERLFSLYTGGMLTYMVDIGQRTGLFDAAALGPATSQDLADRADLQERYVREWLGAMVTGGIVDYNPADGRYTLPAEHAACLTGRTSANVAPFSALNTHLAKHVGEVTDAFRHGGGVPYERYRLVPGGRFVMFDTHASSNLEDNIAHPLAPFLYAVSTLHCMTVSLSADGAGLGTVWGEQRARQMLTDAGFVDVLVRDVPKDPVNALYIARKAASG